MGILNDDPAKRARAGKYGKPPAPPAGLDPRAVTAEQFIGFMDAIWGMKTEPGPDGGVIIYGAVGYDEYHNARLTALSLGARRTGGTQIAGECGYVMQFPSGARIAVTGAGSAVEPRPHASLH